MLFYLFFFSSFFFCNTITVAFTKGPQPLVGCYSIFKHHSAKSQPPHRPALHTCNKLSSSETTETSWTEAGQGHFNESRLINIFIFMWLDPQSFYIQSMQCVCVFQRTSSKPCQLYGPTVIAALICLLMTDVMQSRFTTAVDKICRRLPWCISCRASSLSYGLKCKHMCLERRREERWFVD